MRRRAHPEDDLQRSVIQHLEARGAPGIYWFHVPNGGYRKLREARVLKSIGVRAGCPDLIICHEGRFYGLELKADGGRASPAQLAAVEAIRTAGGFAVVAEGLDRALRCLEVWGILRGSTAARADPEYDAADDFGKSINACYEAVRARKAAGGKGWP